MSSILNRLRGKEGNAETPGPTVPQRSREGLPPGQVWGRRFVIYAASGIPKADLATWKLKVTGLVSTPLEYTYDEFNRLPMITEIKSAHCVTKWSIENPLWEGVSIRLLAEKAQVRPEATWVMFHCFDGYTAPIPLEDALKEDSIVALKMNGKPLLPEQGFPARPFMPHLYLWKSAKWLNEIEFISEYRDGYWEMYGYHERGNVADEERFKGDGYKPVPRRAFGTA
ncbi:MAG: sulfite oxidase-like oxidoreductase [Nitrososphaerales archaeon]|jgi:DMSO/TMAO reductase YedYZ molybdopterin-dependent catalytic subunit